MFCRGACRFTITITFVWIGPVHYHKRGDTFLPIGRGEFRALSGGAPLNGDLLLAPLLGEERLQSYYESEPSIAPADSRTDSANPPDDPDDADEPPLGTGNSAPTDDPDDAFIHHNDDESARVVDGGKACNLASRFRCLAPFNGDVVARQSFEQRQHTETSAVKIYKEKDTVCACWFLFAPPYIRNANIRLRYVLARIYS